MISALKFKPPSRWWSDKVEVLESNKSVADSPRRDCSKNSSSSHNEELAPDAPKRCQVMLNIPITLEDSSCEGQDDDWEDDWDPRDGGEVMEFLKSSLELEKNS
eukprot:TRINITY_DN54751_c0_g1_i1.p1 TRINITY_DN54751_c0_g1~~TRINITY_DN54751_c0_g1_i1.p1  ORF type:complete len:104 (+),score=29.96 TRINITY_DN54751_c0_g1_i1:73-384(+)